MAKPTKPPTGLSPWSPPPGVDLQRPSPATRAEPPVPPQMPDEAGRGPPGVVSGVALALVGVGMLAAPQVNAAIVHSTDSHTDQASSEAVGSIYLHVRGLLELRLAPTGVQVDVNPAAVAALVLARRVPDLLKALLKGRRLGDFLRGERLRPSELKGLRAESLSLVERLQLAPQAVRDEVVSYFSGQGIEDAGAVAGEIEALAARQIAGHDVFISYSHLDGGELPRLIQARLRQEGYTVFEHRNRGRSEVIFPREPRTACLA